MPATTTFMAKVKVNNQKLLAFLLLTLKRGIRWKFICSNIKSY